MTTINGIPKKRDLLSLAGLSAEEIERLFRRAAELKAAQHRRERILTLEGRTLGMIFEKSSTRTRVSFEVGMFQMGGQALFLSAKEIQLGRGEPVSDSARVLSRYVDAIMVRTFAQSKLVTMARHADVPVINGLSDTFHPCQVLADLFTYEERRGGIRGKRVAWIGDGNNMANTWIEAAAILGFELALAFPAGYEPDAEVLRWFNEQPGTGKLHLLRDPKEAAAGADLVTTDVWTSMGQEAENGRRLRDFIGYGVDRAVMALAQPEALFMHCLPAHRGEEVTAEVLEGPQSVVWDEAENRLHVQKAILEWLMLWASFPRRDG